jgi:Methyltransferase domain
MSAGRKTGLIAGMTTTMQALSAPFAEAPTATQHRFPPSKLAAYLRRGCRDVEGWLTPLSAKVVAFLLQQQTKTGFVGAVGEIGVHHGKLFLVEYLSTRADEAAFAIDLFEQKQLNVDHSGKGDRERFLDNVRVYAGSTDGLVVIGADSRQVTPEHILTQAGRARFVSVDDGHTEECARSDLRLAESCLAAGGIILLDDYCNQNWPDVSIRAASHLLAADARTKPFLITPDKVFLAEKQYHRMYQQAVRSGFAGHYTRSCNMFGAPVDIYLREGMRNLSSAIAALITDEARIRLAGHPKMNEFVKGLWARMGLNLS